MDYFEVLAAVVAWVVLPGLAVGALLDCRSPIERIRPERFATFALAGGLSVWVIGARVLDRIGGLSRGPTIAFTLLLGIASIAALLGPGRSTLRALKGRPTAIFAGWAGGSILLGAAPLLHLVLGQRDSLVNSTPWYYWNLVRQTVAAGGTPSQSYEWGQWVTFLDAYPGFTPATAVFALVGGTGSLAAAHAVTVISMLSAGLAMFLLVRALGGRLWGAAFATVMFFAVDVFSSKLSSLRPESLGYAFALLTPVLVLEYVRTGHKRVLVLLAATFVGLGQVHGIDWLFGCGMVVAAVLAGYPVLRSAEIGQRRTRVEAKRWLFRGAVVGVVTLGAWAIANFGLSSNLSGASDLGGLPEIVGDVDPTWEFAALAQGNPGSTPPTVTDLLTNSLKRGFRGLGWPWVAAFAALGLAALIARAFVGPASPARSVARRALVFLGVSAGIAFAISVFFNIGWSTYVPRRTGFARLLQVALLLLPIGAGVAVSVVPSGETPVIRRRIAALTAALALLFAVFVTVHGQDVMAARARQRPLPETLGALRDLGLDENDILLTNVYSEGVVPVMTGARGAIDGRAPYANSKLLARANTLLAGTRAYMAGPATGAPLPCAGITHLLVATGGWALGSPFVFPTDFAGLETRPELELVSDSPGFRLYRVIGDSPPLGGDQLDCRVDDAEV